MRIHKAWFGPKAGHSLLFSTEPSLQGVFRQATWLTDLPDTLPNGLQWEAYFRTGIKDGYFVLVHTRSSRDTSRAGMVDSVAAFIPLAELPVLPDFRELAKNLSESHDSEDRTPFEPDAQPAVPIASIHNPMLVEMAHALISTKQRPVVHLGQSGFDAVMLDLLQVVPKQIRREVLFSLTFSPTDSVGTFAVAVPMELASRYPHDRVLSVSGQPPSIGAAALLNLPEGRALLDFGDAAAFDMQSASALPLLEQAYLLWATPGSVSDAIRLVRLLAARSGNAPSAAQVRKVALRRLTSLSEQWTAADVLSMRNLPLDRFEDSDLPATVMSWIRQHAVQVPAGDDDCHLFSQASRSCAQQRWWNTQTQAGYASAINSSADSMGALAWKSINGEREGIESILAQFDVLDKLPSLAGKVPETLSPPVADAVARGAAARSSWKLCGAALAAAHTPSEALSAVLRHEPTKHHRRLAIETALSKASPSDLLAIAVREDIAEVTQIAAESVMGAPHLLQKFDWTSPVWFEILDRTVAKNRRSAAEIPERLKGLKALIQRSEHSTRVWGPLVMSGLADLAFVENRAEAWEVIPTSLTAAVLEQTVKGWLAGALEGTLGIGGLEEPLRGEVKASLRDHTLMATVAHRSPILFINIINELHPQTDHDCAALLDSLARAPAYRLAPTPATALGKLIRDRSWKLAATRAASLGRYRDEFLPVCRECLSTMVWWDRYPLSSRVGKPSQIPSDEAWTMFEETLADRYPQGPMQDEFWSRSGGKDSQLSTEGNGLAQWHRCIKHVRAGKAPSHSELLKTALRDYSQNAVFQVLRDSRALD